MQHRMKYGFAFLATLAFVILCLVPVIAATAVVAPDSWNPKVVQKAEKYRVRRFVDRGRLIDQIAVPGRPPKNFKVKAVAVPPPNLAGGVNALPSVPTFDWCYGCSATSAAMMMGYYDSSGWPGMYAGPANSGNCPMTNAIWGFGECPLSATHQGFDGLAVRGHVDDYWIAVGNGGPDPYVGHWPEHTQKDCTGDFMGTNQSKYSNSDSNTWFYFWTNGDPCYDYADDGVHRDGCHGMRLFVQSRSQVVSENFNQYIKGYLGNTRGFTYEDFQKEIDSGRPVMIQVAGHSMVGFGYDASANRVYIHDTWDHNTHQMTWGGTYAGLQHYGVTVIRIKREEYLFSTKWGSYGPGNGQFNYPDAVCTDSSGNVYVSDTNSNRIQKFDSNGTYITKWGSYGNGDGQLSAPRGICADGSNVYVADYWNDRICKFQLNGTFVGWWGGCDDPSHAGSGHFHSPGSTHSPAWGTGDGELYSPTDVCKDSSGNVYVADYNNNRIQKFSSVGVYQAKWGSYGTGDGQFDHPSGVCTDSAGNIYVVDNGNNRVQKFNSSRVFQTKWGSSGSNYGQFSFPWDICADPGNGIFVADTGNNRIQKFDSNGTPMLSFGSAGSGDGQFNGPDGVCSNSVYQIYVADTGNNRIQRFYRNVLTPAMMGINTARLASTDYPIELTDAIITTKLYGDYYPIGLTMQDLSGASGIRVLYNEETHPGDIVTVRGVTADVDGERAIDARSGGSVIVQTTGSGPPPPVIAQHLDTGGGQYGDQPPVVDDASATPPTMGKGIPNLGVYMKIRGIVTASVMTGMYSGYFYVNDGYGDPGSEMGLRDGSGFVGIKCRPAPDPIGHPLPVPGVGQYVEVTGTMGVTMIAGLPARYFWTSQIGTPTFGPNPSPVFTPGWNVISLPAQPRNSDPADVFTGLDISGNLWKWDAWASSFVAYDTWTPQTFGPATSSAGYWLMPMPPNPVNYTGYADPMSSPPTKWISGAAGWNLIGSPFTHGTHWMDWKVVDGLSVKTIEEARNAGWMDSVGWWWDAGAQSFRTVGLPDDFPATEYTVPCLGYWVNLYEELGILAPGSSTGPE